MQIELLISENKIKCINHEPEQNTEVSKVSEAVTRTESNSTEKFKFPQMIFGIFFFSSKI